MTAVTPVGEINCKVIVVLPMVNGILAEIACVDTVADALTNPAAPVCAIAVAKFSGATTILAMPNPFVSAVPADGINDVRLVVLVNVTNVLATGFPELSVTFAATVYTPEVLIELLTTPFELSRLNLIVGDDTADGPPELKLVELLTTTLDPAVTLAEAVTVPAPALLLLARVTCAHPVLLVNAVPFEGTKTPTVESLTVNVTNTPETGLPLASSACALATRLPLVGIVVVGRPAVFARYTEREPLDVVTGTVAAKLSVAVTAVEVTGTADTVSAAAPPVLPPTRWICAIPALFVSAVPDGGAIVATVLLLTVNVTSTFCCATPLALTTVADAIK